MTTSSLHDSSRNVDFIVVGAGMVGAAIALGLLRRGRKVVVFDGGDTDFRAARGNGGLIWVHSKGAKYRPYREITERSALAWGEFARLLHDLSGVDVAYRMTGGLSLCLSEADRERRIRTISSSDPTDPGCKAEMIDRSQIDRLLQGVPLSRDVIAGSFNPLDSEVDPLKMLRAMHGAILALGGRLIRNCPVSTIKKNASGFKVIGGGGVVAHSDRLVIAAGLGAASLARQLDAEVEIIPERGHMMITERLAPLSRIPIIDIRQMREGSLLLGTTKEKVGLDNSAVAAGGATIASRVVRIMPALAHVRIVRYWACLRIRSRDGFPIYSQLESCPGAFLVSCHSGVTLAAAHSGELADAIDQGDLTQAYNAFSPARFHVPTH